MLDIIAFVINTVCRQSVLTLSSLFALVSITGGELMDYIYKKKKLDEDETHKFMQQIVSAVDHLHKAGIIHRYSKSLVSMIVMCNTMAW